MKKKIVGLMFSLVLALGCSACTNQAQYPDGSGSEEQSVSSEAQTGESNADPSGENGSGASGESGNGNGTETAVTRSYSPKLLNTGYGSGDALYMVDETGSKITEYDWPQITKELQDKGYGDFSSATIETTDGKMVYLYRYDEMDNGYCQSVYAVDLAKKEAAKVYSLESNRYVESVDVFGDKIYIDCYDYEEGYHLTEQAFERQEGTSAYREVETGSKALQDVLDTCTRIWTYSSETDECNSECSLARSFAENGYVLGKQKNGGYIRIFPDGMIKALAYVADEDSYEDVKAYDSLYCIIEKNDADWKTHLYVLELNSSETKEMTPKEGSDFSFLDYEEGMLYYCESTEKDYIYETNKVYQKNLDNGMVRELYEAVTVPGATTIQPGTQKFQVTNGAIFFVGIEGSDVRWYRREINKSSVEPIGSVIETKDVFRYGSVIYDTYLGKCDLCGITLEKYYGEAFQLDSQYSQYADKINECLAGYLKQTIADYQTVNPDYVPDPEECEYHQEMPFAYCETVEDYITDVMVVNERYLIVDMNGYWYGGGAHGQPYIIQYVFDLADGEKKTIKDFYKGTQEDFKKLLATKTRENFESYDDDEYGSPYYSDDPDEIYNSAYEYGDLESSQIIFGKDVAYLVYDPYQMGPYASGFIEIEISYEELLGRSGL